MRTITATAVPDDTLLAAYVRDGSFADCYRSDIAASVSHAQFVEAFYTTWLFKAERGVLALLASAPSTDRDVAELAAGRRDTFAAWTVEARAPGQILLAALRTRSWLMVEATNGRTRLYFGSAVVPETRKDGRRSLGPVFAALLGFHRLYSRALLRAARARLEASRSGTISGPQGPGS